MLSNLGVGNLSDNFSSCLLLGLDHVLGITEFTLMVSEHSDPFMIRRMLFARRPIARVNVGAGASKRRSRS